MNKLRTFFKKIFPWLVAVAIFAWLFRQYPPSSIYNALQFINAPFFCAVALGYFVLMLFIDTFSISRILARFGHPEPIKELLPARGTTYLLMVVNYAAAQAAFAFYQNRKHGIPISKMLGIFGIIVVVDLMLLSALAFATTFFTTWPLEAAGMNIATFVRIFTIAAFAGFAALILLANAAANLGFVKKLRRHRIVELIVTTRPGDYLAVMIARLPVHIFIMCGMYVAMRSFNMEIPFIKVISNIPIIFFIGSLPITPGGLGTSNAALVALLTPFTSGQAISAGLVSAGDLLFSFSLIWVFANYIMKALTGVICLKFVSRDLFKPTPETTEEQAEGEAAQAGGNMQD